jgi:hypothetical protein
LSLVFKEATIFCAWAALDPRPRRSVLRQRAEEPAQHAAAVTARYGADEEVHLAQVDT